ncbi:MAG: HlyC/CorC family transporter [Mycoplasma sp.]|nr:HlyC/CorC family transporter [Mycoplasma sp.]
MSKSLIIGLSILLVCLILLSSIFSAAETAYSSVNPAKIQQEISKNKKTGRLLKKHLKTFSWTLSTILIGNNLVNICASVLISYILSHTFINNDLLTTILSVSVMTPIIVIFGEILPKLFARKYAYGYLVKIVFLMEILNWFFLPLTLPLKKMSLSSGVTNTEDQIKQLISIGRKEGVIEKREATLATNALEFDSIKVNNIYIKIQETITLNSTDTVAIAKEKFKKSGYTRIPLKHKNEYIGIIHLKDLIFKKNNQDLLSLSYKVPIISKNTILTLALEKLRYEKSYIGFVSATNKDKKVVGIFTMEDIIEELIGEIYDEHDKLGDIREVGLHKLIVEGKTKLSVLEKRLNTNFDNKDSNITVYKWVSNRINRNIKKGLKYIYKNKYIFKVIENKKFEQTIFEITEK